uniref:Thyroid receptor-interacting protein 6 isoform X1 n=2 Tax=Geotrypetes seraphini TaxID=260995 RepID=A0A6P8PBW6_GEOSA|nr:thyroid receptor-interacting protein 6 isoform X1 [Geotrypetes seraphini]
MFLDMSGPTWLPPRHLSSPEQPGIAGSGSVSVSMPAAHKPQRKFATVPAPKVAYGSYETSAGVQGAGPQYQQSPSGAFSLLRSHPEDSGALSTGPGDFHPLSPGASDRRYPATSTAKDERGSATWGPTSATSTSFQMQSHSVDARPQRPSSLDTDIDALTNLLAHMESSGPPRRADRQNFESIAYPPGSPSGPVLRAPSTYKPGPLPASGPYSSASKPQGYSHQEWYSGSSQHMPQKPYPQPTPAPYATASTPAGSSFNIQVQVAQPVPNYTQPHRRVEQAYGPQAPSRPVYGEQNWYQPIQYAGRPDHPLDAGYALHSARRSEPQLYSSGAKASVAQYQPGSGKTNKEELGPLRQTPEGLTSYRQQGSVTRPEEELDRLTKKLIYDMNHPPAGEYFGRCARCGENVVGDGTGCIAMEQVFHVECFTCITCQCHLRGQPFYSIDKKSYCEACYIVTLEKCCLCSKPILDRILRAVGKTYHPECFVCVVCRRCLDGVPFTVDASSQIHCIEDFHLKFAPRCSVCGNAIMPEPGQEETVRIVALDRSFHIGCYKCEECGLLLSSEGEGRGCYPLDGHILCKSCSGRRIQELSSKITTDC